MYFPKIILCKKLLFRKTMIDLTRLSPIKCLSDYNDKNNYTPKRAFRQALFALRANLPLNFSRRKLYRFFPQ